MAENAHGSYNVEVYRSGLRSENGVLFSFAMRFANIAKNVENLNQITTFMRKTNPFLEMHAYHAYIKRSGNKWILFFAGILSALTGILLAQFIWTYYADLFNKGIPTSYLLQLFAEMFLIMLPLPILVSIFVTQLVASIMNPEKRLPAVLKRHLAPAFFGTILLFLFMAFLIPEISRSAYTLLFDIRMKGVNEKAWKRAGASVCHGLIQTMTLPRLITVAEQQKNSGRTALIERLIRSYDLKSADKLLTKDNINFFRFTNQELAEIRGICRKNAENQLDPNIIKYEAQNLSIAKENYQRYWKTIKYTFYVPILFLIIYLILPQFVLSLRRFAGSA